MQKAYTRIIWKNEPSHDTPLNESNLNRMDNAVDVIDDRVIELSNTKADESDLLSSVKNISVDESTGVFTIEWFNGTTKRYDTKLEKIAINFAFDVTTQQIVITLDDGTKQYIDLSELITQYEFADTDTIVSSVTDGKVAHSIKKGSITDEYLKGQYLTQIQTAESNAAGSANNAADSATAAKNSADNSADSAKLSESYARGGTGSREGESTDNSLYYKNQAEAAKTEAKASETNAKASETAAKASEAAAKASESAAKASEENAKTSEGAAKASETVSKASENAAKASETAAKASETNAKASETASKQSEQNAAASERNSNTSAVSAGASADAATSSASAALQSEQNASQSASSAKTSEDNAKDSEDAAKQSEQNSKTSEDNAARSAGSSSDSAGRALTSEQNAKTSEENAAASESNAQDYMNLSKSYAVGTNDIIRTGDSSDNSKYYCNQSQSIRDECQRLKDSMESATDEVDRKLNLAEFSVDDNGNLIYTDNSVYIFTIDNEGNLNWGVA